MGKSSVKYNYIDLPSGGQCYPHKKRRVAVSYITVKDEDMLVKSVFGGEDDYVDKLLRKKIKDSDFVVDNLCVGDRDAILMALLKNSYGKIHVDTETGERTDLSKIEIHKTDVKGDEEGLFSYVDDKGTEYKYRYVRKDEEKEGWSMMGENPDYDTANKVRRWILERITVSVNSNNDGDFVKEYLQNLDDDDMGEYFAHIYNNNVYLESDIDFEEALMSEIL
ncbi:MAG: hypothetical protein LUD72_12890, partial [Bacteroidales bacterium]|nr:hypothetical protein [Bacteroidales bacterium]